MFSSVAQPSPAIFKKGTSLPAVFCSARSSRNASSARSLQVAAKSHPPSRAPLVCRRHRKAHRHRFHLLSSAATAAISSLKFFTRPPPPHAVPHLNRRVILFNSTARFGPCRKPTRRALHITVTSANQQQPLKVGNWRSHTPNHQETNITRSRSADSSSSSSSKLQNLKQAGWWSYGGGLLVVFVIGIWVIIILVVVVIGIWVILAVIGRGIVNRVRFFNFFSMLVSDVVVFFKVKLFCFVGLLLLLSLNELLEFDDLDFRFQSVGELVA